MIHIIVKNPCEVCNDTSAEENDYGMIRPCSRCSGSYESFVNKFGTDEEEHPVYYIDQSIGVSPVVIDRRKDYILLPNGTVIPVPVII